MCLYLATLVYHVLCFCDTDPMKLTWELDLDILTMYLHTKNKVCRSRFSKVRARPVPTHTDATTTAVFASNGHYTSFDDGIRMFGAAR